MPYQFDKWGNLKPLTNEKIATLDEEGASIIVLSQGRCDDGRAYWLYIAVKAGRYDEFMRLARAHQRTVFADYGTILRYGYAEQVPETVKQEMKEGYGWDDNYVISVRQDIEYARVAFLKEESTKDTTRFIEHATMLKHKQSQE